MTDPLDVLTCLDWLTPLVGLAQVAAGRVRLLGPVEAIVLLEGVGVSCGAPMWVSEHGVYLFTVKRKDLSKARRVLARAGVEVW